MRPKKTDPYDHKPVIAYAIKEARKTGRDHYVAAHLGRWTCLSEQPQPWASHWRAKPNGSLDAHLGGLDKAEAEYRYEPVAM